MRSLILSIQKTLKVEAKVIAKVQEAKLQNSDLKNEVDYLMADIRDLEDQLQASIPNAHENIHDLEVSNEELNGKNSNVGI